jgi:hypothetical protein
MSISSVVEMIGMLDSKKLFFPPQSEKGIRERGKDHKSSLSQVHFKVLFHFGYFGGTGF